MGLKYSKLLGGRFSRAEVIKDDIQNGKNEEPVADTKIVPTNGGVGVDVDVVSEEDVVDVVSEREIVMLKEMWTIVKTDIERVGVITFISLFETHPEVHDAFMSFRAVNTTELEYNQILRAHALRVMGTVDKCIYRLDNRDKLRELMTELGIRHKNYTVKVEFIDLMGPQFINSIKPHLQTMWTEEHEEAWENLFKLMCYYMKKGMCSI